MKVSIDNENKKLIIEIDLLDGGKGKPSASGKNLLIASTQGNQPTDLKIGDETVVVAVNAYYKNPNAPKK